MRRFLWLSLGVLLLACVAASCGGGSQGEAHWMITDLGTLGGPSSEAVAINRRGEVVGNADTRTKDKDGYPISHAFLWRSGKMIDLGTLGGPTSEAVAINRGGEVVGNADTRTKDKEGKAIAHAFLWHHGKMSDLGTLGGPRSWAQAINASGQVVGYAETTVKDEDGQPVAHAFLWQAGKMIDLGTFGGLSSRASDINDRGQIIGEADTTKKRLDEDDLRPHAIRHAFLWKKGKMIDLGVPPGRAESMASEINERSQILGWACLPCSARDPYWVASAFLWQAGRMTTLAPPRGRESCGANAFNEHGEAVGSASDGGAWPRPVLWRAGKASALRLPGELEGEALSINERGQIVGYGGDEQTSHAFLWYHGTRTALPGLGGGWSDATAINANSQIIGGSDTKERGFDLRAVLWTLKRG
jgi:probable HAF family extracellular repeat protein